MRQLVIKGNIVIPKILVNDGGYFEAFSNLEKVDNGAIVIEGDVMMKHPITVDFELYVTGEITEREV